MVRARGGKEPRSGAILYASGTLDVGLLGKWELPEIPLRPVAGFEASFFGRMAGRRPKFKLWRIVRESALTGNERLLELQSFSH
jgi:hypothetical protein